MKLSRSALLTMLAILVTSGLTSPAPAAARNWVEGRNYTVLDPIQRTTVPLHLLPALER